MEANKLQKQSAQTLETLVLFVTIFVVGLCTIVYELLIGSVSSYFLGDSIKQFSITIGLSMAAMGMGTLISRSIHDNLFQWFISVEIILGLIGGLSVPLLFAAYSLTTLYYPIMITLIVIIGILIGLEIPLLTRIMEKTYALRENISNVLSLDYLGALGATLLFPFILLPFFGIFKSSLLIGSLNVLIGLFNFWYFRKYIGIDKAPRLKLFMAAISILLIGMLFWSQNLINAWETNVYEDRVILSKQSAYQKIVLTKHKEDFRLYLDGHLQFSSIDEYRYHESLVHIPLSLMKHPENILVLGGGDGLAVREILKYPGVKTITVVDLDPEITRLGLTNNLFLKLNHSSLKDDRVQIKNVDGFKFLEDASEFYETLINASGYTMALMAFNRFICVCKTEKYKHMFSKKKTLLINCILWVLCCIIGVLLIKGGSSYAKFFPQQSMCTISRREKTTATKILGIMLNVSAIFLPLAVTFYCYLKIIIKIRQHKRNVRQATTGSRSTIGTQEIRTTWTLMAVLIGYLVLWIPVVIVGIASSYNKALPHHITIIEPICMACSSAINPIIYGTMSPAFRKEYRKIFRSISSPVIDHLASYCCFCNKRAAEQ